jgi:hypothetical protein
VFFYFGLGLNFSIQWCASKWQGNVQELKVLILCFSSCQGPFYNHSLTGHNLKQLLSWTISFKEVNDLQDKETEDSSRKETIIFLPSQDLNPVPRD